MLTLTLTAAVSSRWVREGRRVVLEEAISVRLELVSPNQEWERALRGMKRERERKKTLSPCLLLGKKNTPPPPVADVRAKQLPIPGNTEKTARNPSLPSKIEHENCNKPPSQFTTREKLRTREKRKKKKRERERESKSQDQDSPNRTLPDSDSTPVPSSSYPPAPVPPPT